MNKLKKIINSCLLCIRFPFLYPRNRFTDKHYNYWPIMEFHRKWYKHTTDSFIIHFVTESPKELLYTKEFEGGWYRIDPPSEYTNTLSVTDIYGKKKTIFSIPMSEVGEGKIIKTGFVNQSAYCVVEEGWKGKKSLFVSYVHAKWLYKLIKFFDWINNYVLQIFHCIPTYTELDAMPSGWRKTFGIQMCEDIKAELKKHKGALRKYRITQIKEKFGGLRWYDEYSTEKIWKEIIPKYEELSYKTCIDCGKPAEYVSCGWISPYCGNCRDKYHNYIPISEENAYSKALHGDFFNDNVEEEIE